MARRRRFRETLRRPEGIDDVLTRSGDARLSKVRPPISARLWREAVGGRIASRAEPLRVEQGVLLVKVASSVWASELSLLSEAILARLRIAGLDVKRLHFRVGEIAPPDRPPERRKSTQVPAAGPLPADLARHVAAVADPGLRVAIEESARMNLAWQRATEPAPPSEAPRAARVPRGAGTGTAPPGCSSPRKA
jgi:hypothetical protein